LILNGAELPFGFTVDTEKDETGKEILRTSYFGNDSVWKILFEGKLFGRDILLRDQGVSYKGDILEANAYIYRGLMQWSEEAKGFLPKDPWRWGDSKITKRFPDGLTSADVAPFDQARRDDFEIFSGTLTRPASGLTKEEQENQIIAIDWPLKMNTGGYYDRAWAISYLEMGQSLAGGLLLAESYQFRPYLIPAIPVMPG